jgi:hypothetical protein
VSHCIYYEVIIVAVQTVNNQRIGNRDVAEPNFIDPLPKTFSLHHHVGLRLNVHKIRLHLRTVFVFVNGTLKIEFVAMCLLI